MKKLSSVFSAATVMFLLFLACATGARAQEPPPALALHISAPQTSPCSPVVGDPRWPARLTEFTINTAEPGVSTPQGPFFFVYLLACRGSESSGISGFECGINYQGGVSASGGYFPINVFGWHLCADAEAPGNGWPASDGTNLITWLPANCQNTRSSANDPNSVMAIGGYFYLACYAPAEIRTTPRLDVPHTRLLACDGTSTDLDTCVPSRFGLGGFGGYQGYNPCVVVVPTERQTWGGLKSLYR